MIENIKVKKDKNSSVLLTLQDMAKVLQRESLYVQIYICMYVCICVCVRMCVQRFASIHKIDRYMYVCMYL